jgi:hypothetical protein
MVETINAVLQAPMVVSFRKQLFQFRQALFDIGKKLAGVSFPVLVKPQPCAMGSRLGFSPFGLPSFFLVAITPSSVGSILQSLKSIYQLFGVNSVLPMLQQHLPV